AAGALVRSREAQQRRRAREARVVIILAASVRAERATARAASYAAPAGAASIAGNRREAAASTCAPAADGARLCTRQPSLHAEQPVDAPRVRPEALVRLQVERARTRQLDLEVVRHARRTGGEDDDARAEEHRLGDAVRHEHDRLAGFLPDAQQLEVH